LKLKLVITQQTPPGGWPYTDPDTGRKFNHYVLQVLKQDVRNHRKANNLPVAPDLNDQIEDQICKSVPPEWCGGVGSESRLPPLSFSQAIHGTALLMDWVAHGTPLVDQAEANSRSRTCAHCYANSGIEGCSNCSMDKLRELVVRIVGNKRTEGDDMIQACKICGCALKAKVWVPLNILQRHLSAEQNEQFPEWCWCKKSPP